MKTYIREAIEELEALGFRDIEDQFGRRGHRNYTHPNDPEVSLRLYDRATQAACIAIRKKAHEIAGLSTAGPSMPKTVGERKRMKKSKARAERAQQKRLMQEHEERGKKAE